MILDDVGLDDIHEKLRGWSPRRGGRLDAEARSGRRRLGCCLQLDRRADARPIMICQRGTGDRSGTRRLPAACCLGSRLSMFQTLIYPWSVPAATYAPLSPPAMCTTRGAPSASIKGSVDFTRPAKLTTSTRPFVSRKRLSSQIAPETAALANAPMERGASGESSNSCTWTAAPDHTSTRAPCMSQPLMRKPAGSRNCFFAPDVCSSCNACASDSDRGCHASKSAAHARSQKEDGARAPAHSTARDTTCHSSPAAAPFRAAGSVHPHPERRASPRLVPTSELHGLHKGISRGKRLPRSLGRLSGRDAAAFLWHDASHACPPRADVGQVDMRGLRACQRLAPPSPARPRGRAPADRPTRASASRWDGAIHEHGGGGCTMAASGGGGGGADPEINRR